MKPGFSNISLPAFSHDHMFAEIAGMGYQGVEVAPSRVWEQPEKVSFFEVSNYRKKIEKCGMEVIGLHSLTFNSPELKLFSDEVTRKKLKSFLIYLGGLCNDLGGKVMVFGSPQSRGLEGKTLMQANLIAYDFFLDLVCQLSEKKIIFCLEPLGKKEVDFANCVSSVFELVQKINNKSFQIQLDAKSLIQNDELEPDLFGKIASYLVHFHVNNLEFKPLTSSGVINHSLISSLLRGVSYSGFVSLEQRMWGEAACLDDLRKSMRVISKYYL